MRSGAANKGRRWASTLICLTSGLAHGSGQNASEVLHIDGVGSEPRWDQVVGVAADFEIAPLNRQQSEWHTIVKVHPGTDAIYVLVLADDPHPGLINAVPSRSDEIRASDDQVTLYIDPEGSGKRAFSFTVNARGSTADSIESSTGANSAEWDGDWTEKVATSDSGYSVEFRVPYRTLGIGSGVGRSIGWNVTRQVGRGRFPTLSASHVDTFMACLECQYEKLDVKSANTHTSSLRVLPYFTASRESVSGSDVHQRQALGLDAQWQDGAGKKALLTLNPDFSQVAIDRIQFTINQRYALAYPERRPFFTEDAGLYKTMLPLVYTRNVLQPNVGAQFVSRKNGSSEYGFFATDDEFTSYVVPGLQSSSRRTFEMASKNFVGRYTTTKANGDSAGILLTAKDSGNLYRNVVGSVDGSVTLGNARVSGQLARSSSQDGGVGSAGVIQVVYGKQPFISTTTLEAFGKDFRADLGRVNQVGIMSLSNSEYYEYTANAQSYWESWAVGADFQEQREIGGSSLFNSESVTVIGANKRNGSIAISVASSTEDFDQTSFSTHTATLGVTQRFGPRWSINLQASGGSAVDYSVPVLGTTRSIYIGPTYKGSKFITGSFSVSRATLDSPKGLSFETTAVNTSLTADISKRHHITMVTSFGAVKAWSMDGSTEESSELDWQIGYQYDLGNFRWLAAGMAGSLQSDRVGLNSLAPVRNFAFIKFVYGLDY